MTELTVRVCHGLGELDATEWDRLAARSGFYGCAAWLLAWERHADRAPTVVAVVDGAGRLVAAAPCFLGVSGVGNPRYDLAALFGAVLPPGTSWDPQLICGGTAGYAGAVLVDPLVNEAVRHTALDRLLAGVRRLGQTSGAGSIALLYLDPVTAAQLVRHTGTAAALVTTVAARVEVVWPDFEGYLAAQSTSRRSNIRRDIRRFDEAGYELVVDRLSPWIDAIAPLLARVQGHHGFDDSAEGAAAYLRLCASAGLDERSVLFLARRGQSIDGFTLGYRFAHGLYLRVVGLDYENSHRHGVYFSVYCYEPIRYALAHGLRHVELGVEALEGKLRKGARPHLLWSLVDLPGITDPTTVRDIEHRWNREQRGAWIARHQRLDAALASDAWCAPR